MLAGFIRRRPNLALLYLVDVIDFVDFPAADVMQPHQGLTLAETRMALQILGASNPFMATGFAKDQRCGLLST